VNFVPLLVLLANINTAHTLQNVCEAAPPTSASWDHGGCRPDAHNINTHNTLPTLRIAGLSATGEVPSSLIIIVTNFGQHIIVCFEDITFFVFCLDYCNAIVLYIVAWILIRNHL
jgi:hypothetical protein